MLAQVGRKHPGPETQAARARTPPNACNLARVFESAFKRTLKVVRSVLAGSHEGP